LSVQASLESLKSRFRSFVEEVRREKDQVLIISHYDADGLSSFSLMAYFLKKNDVPFHATFVEQVYPETLAQLPFENYSCVVFLDLGSGYKNLIRERIGDKHKVLVIDHHIPSAPRTPTK
jgi:single-stranded-DNA-specific exonuclease